MPFKHFRIDELRIRRVGGMARPTLIAQTVKPEAKMPLPEQKVAAK